MTPGRGRWAAGFLLAGALTLSGCASSEPDIDQIVDDLSQVREGDALWQGDAQSCVTGTLDPGDPDVASALEIAMPEDKFWNLIAVLNGQNSQADVDRLSATLAETTVDDLIAFDARLTLALYALDDECHLLGFRDSHRWDGGWVDGDSFLYARADTVAAGREQWESAISDGALPAGETDPMMGELLLYAAHYASAELGLEEFELWDLERERFSLSYESGSNPTGWSDERGGFLMDPDDIGG